jgi:hypothetical protein
VFELDHPVTAALKQARVRKVFGVLPEHVTYVSADLEREDLSAALERAGYERGVRTLFIWSGVSFYLSAQAVDSVLAFVRSGSGPGSSIVFDYHYRGFTDGTRDYYGGTEGRRRVEELGEPCIFGIEEGGVSMLLARNGLELISDLGPAELEGRYLVRSDGSRDGRPFGFISIAHARSPGHPEARQEAVLSKLKAQRPAVAPTASSASAPGSGVTPKESMKRSNAARSPSSCTLPAASAASGVVSPRPRETSVLASVVSVIAGSDATPDSILTAPVATSTPNGWPSTRSW